MASEKINFTTPVGRIISGSLTEQNKHAYDSKAPNGRGVELPQDKWYYWFRVAFLKTQAGGTAGDINGLLNLIYGHTLKSYQAIDRSGGIVARAQSGPMDPHSTFAWKIEDGDAVGADGKRKFGEEAAGSWLFSMRSAYPIKCANGLAANAECPPDMIKRGYYVDIYATCSINDQTDHTAGIYINPGIVRLVGYGAEISGGPSIAQAFGSAPAPQLPPGASAVPVAGTMPAPMPGQPQTTAPAAGPMPMPVPGGVPMPSAVPAGYAMPAPQPQPGAYGAMPGMAQPQTAYPGNPAPMPGQPQTTSVPGYPQFVPGYQPQPALMPGQPQTTGVPMPMPGYGGYPPQG